MRWVQKALMDAANPIGSTTSGVLVEEMVNVGRGSSGVVAGEPPQHVNQSWDWFVEALGRCSQRGREYHDEVKAGKCAKGAKCTRTGCRG